MLIFLLCIGDFFHPQKPTEERGLIKGFPIPRWDRAQDMLWSPEPLVNWQNGPPRFGRGLYILNHNKDPVIKQSVFSMESQFRSGTCSFVVLYFSCPFW